MGSDLGGQGRASGFGWGPEGRGSDCRPGKVDAFSWEARQGLRRDWWSHPPPPGLAVPMLAPRPLLLLLVVGLTLGAGLPPGPRSHPGVCPNQLSPNLWVDAQSTCERECVGDQVSTGTVPTSPGWGSDNMGCSGQLGGLASPGEAQPCSGGQALPTEGDPRSCPAAPVLESASSSGPHTPPLGF